MKLKEGLQYCFRSRINPISIVWRLFYHFAIAGNFLIVGANAEIRSPRRIRTSSKPVFIGIKYVGFESVADRIVLNCAGRLEFLGRFSIGRGCRLDIGTNSKVVLGEDSYLNSRCLIVSMHGLTIGRGCAISWNCQFLDENFHTISYMGSGAEKSIIEDPRIVIGDRVWIGCNCLVLRGVHIADGCVVAANSVVTSSFLEQNCLIAGSPARVVRRGVSWA